MYFPFIFTSVQMATKSIIIIIIIDIQEPKGNYPRYMSNNVNIIIHIPNVQRILLFMINQ